MAPTSGIPANPKFKLNLSYIILRCRARSDFQRAAEEDLGAEFGASIMAVHKASRIHWILFAGRGVSKICP
ncbi:unnamed protein product [Calypogeia fissa]